MNSRSYCIFSECAFDLHVVQKRNLNQCQQVCPKLITSSEKIECFKYMKTVNRLTHKNIWSQHSLEHHLYFRVWANIRIRFVFRVWWCFWLCFFFNLRFIGKEIIENWPEWTSVQFLLFRTFVVSLSFLRWRLKAPSSWVFIRM